MPVEPSEHLSRLFSQEILGKLPSSGYPRVRRTMLVLIGIQHPENSHPYLTASDLGSYASWFTTLPSGSSVLLNVVSFVVTALRDPSLCLPSAN